jgi:CheY-like chemotaxis protein
MADQTLYDGDNFEMLRRYVMAGVIFSVSKQMVQSMRATILTVDDQPLFRALMRRIAEQHTDLDVVGEAADGREAIQRTRELRPDLVLLDLVLPEVNGLEATQQIKAAPPCEQGHYRDRPYRGGLPTGGGRERCGRVSPEENAHDHPPANDPVPARPERIAECALTGRITDAAEPGPAGR